MKDLLRRLRYLLRRQQFEDDLAEEMEFHRAMKQREFEARGETSEDAAAASRQALGNAALARDQARDVWMWPWLFDGVRDVRYAIRTLGRNPGFAIVAVLTLALGIGANTAIFSIINAVLLRSLPVQDPQQLMFFGKTAAAGSTGFTPSGNTELFSYQFFRDFRRDNQVFSDVAAIGSILFSTSGRVAGGAGLEKLNIELVSGSYFSTLGVPPITGRTLTDADDRTPGGGPVAVASYSWALRRFGRFQSAVGSTVSIGSRLYVIVDITPREFSGVTVGQSPDLWIPLTMQRDISPGWNGLEQPMFQTLHLVARLKPGIGLASAQASTNLLFRNILRGYVGAEPSQNTLNNIQRAYIELTPAASGRSDLRSQFSSPLKILMAVVAMVLVIACANVANLLLARATARQREIAVRMALGAGRFRLVRQLLAESLLLGVSGAVLGILLASSASRLLIALVSTGAAPLPLAVGPDVTVLTFTLVATIITVLLFGGAPALHTTRLNLGSSLKDGGSVTSSPGRTRLSRSLVVGQIALSLALIAGAILFLRSLTNLMDIDMGFDKRHVVVASIDPGAAGYKIDDRLDVMMTRIEERIASIPGVHAASFAFFVFNGGSWSTDDIAVPGRQRSNMDGAVVLNLVGPQYLDALKMPILAGRTLSRRDTAATRRVAVINETMARTYFGEPFPLGRTFTVHDDENAETKDLENIEVVGVVRDAKYMTLEERQMPAAFFPHTQHRRNFLFTLVVRHDGAAAAVVTAMREAVANIDPNLPFNDVTTLERLVDDSVVNRRAIAQLSAFFGLLAMVLACIGIYGVTSYGIARRTNEFGIRMALGAGKRHVLWLVLGDTLRTGVLGIAIGLVIAAAGGRSISSLLVGLTPRDPVATGAAVVTMLAVSVLAGYVPACRATRIDPLRALRHD